MSLNTLACDLSTLGVAALPAARLKASLSPSALSAMERLSESFAHLSQDRHMGDGGTYRFRRYSRYSVAWNGEGFVWSSLAGNSINQSIHDNPLNGGVRRTFEPLSPEVAESPLLRELLAHDADLLRHLDPSLFEKPVTVGVHQVRIVALPESQGKPTPEGIHRDSERYTFQHFWSRSGVEGGEFRAYDQEQSLVFQWLQSETLDSALFEGATWHSATPIRCLPGVERGYRDIFLIDFDR